MFQDDVKLMADTNLEAYRFSIAWSRLVPGSIQFSIVQKSPQDKILFVDFQTEILQVGGELSIQKG